jgi:rhamnogalacturonyl hydrolase YesR
MAMSYVLLAGVLSPARGGELPGLPAPAGVLAKMVAVATWQEAHPSHWPDLDWTRAPYYLGLLATTRATGDEKWAEAVRRIGRNHGWALGKRPFMADDHAVGQAWLALYQQDRLPEQRVLVEAGIKAFAARPVERSLAWKGKIHDREWAWCDALFMSPQVLAGMTTVSGDRSWLGKMDARYWPACDYLFDSKENLFVRDSSYFTKREANGAKVFWSRGNGWVFAGLVHILQQMPSGHPTRPKYLDLFRRLATRLQQLQQPDGSWHASLLDPAGFPVPESSGTAFFCYGLLWGVNQNLLARETTLPAALRAWYKLASQVQPDGMLGSVQPCGVSPRQVTADMTEVYGTGGLLLAGSELHNLILLDGARRAEFQAHNPAKRNRLREVTAIPWEEVTRLLPAPVAARLVVRDCQTGQFVASQVLDDNTDGKPDKLLYSATLLPEQTRAYELVETKQAVVPAPSAPLRYATAAEPIILQIRQQ